MAKLLRPQSSRSSGHLQTAASFFIGITVVSVFAVPLGPRLALGANRLVRETVSYRMALDSQRASSQANNDLVHTTSLYSQRQSVKSLPEDGSVDANKRKRSRSSSESGAVSAAADLKDRGRANEESIHVIVTSNGSPYLNWQTRIMHHTFKKVAAAPDSAMRHFTRVLHRTSDDALMNEIPTVRVEPLDPSCDVWCEYPVASRPSAIRQWLESGDPRGEWVLMAETDHLFIKPFSIPISGRNLGFPFSYMRPGADELRPYMNRLYECPGCSFKDIPPTGNAPLLIRIEDLRKVVPLWEDLTARIEADEDMKTKLGWVREMYAFSIAVAMAKVDLDLPKNPRGIMVQPPEDGVLGQARIIHYTWGNVIKDGKESVVWSWDKREFVEPGLPVHIKEPPGNLASEVQSLWIRTMNDAIDNLSRYCSGELAVMAPADRAAAEAAMRSGVT